MSQLSKKRVRPASNSPPPNDEDFNAPINISGKRSRVWSIFGRVSRILCLSSSERLMVLGKGRADRDPSLWVQ